MPFSDRIRSALQAAVEDGTFPGAVLSVQLRDEVVYETAVGRRSLKDIDSAVTVDTCYDLASLTKVLATTTAWTLLIQQAQLELGTAGCLVVND